MAMLKMMMSTGARQMKIVAVGVVRFELSLQTLLAVIKKEIRLNASMKITQSLHYFIHFQILKTTYSITMLIKSM